MPGKMTPCALCAIEATVYCVNDDAHLCTACDVQVHAANPLLARHERRQLSAMACQAECASAACGATAAGAPAASHCTDDVCVVPCLAAPAAEVPALAPEPLLAAPQPKLMSSSAYAGADVGAGAAPLALYEDSFLARELTTSDLLDLDDLELPCASSPTFAAFDPLDDCVVPAWGEPAGDAAAGALMHDDSYQRSFMSQPYLGGGYGHPYAKPVYTKPAPAAPARLVPMGAAPAAAKPAAQASAGPLSAADAEAEAARVQRHRERQRKKRAFGRAVRYQSRRAYAEIRPRIKGRFVTPEEYAVYQAQMTAAEKAAADAENGVDFGEHEEGDAAGQEAEVEDAVVPQPPAALAAAPAYVAAA